MSATLTQPPARSYSLDPIWIGMETDLITGAAAYFEITISDGGPTATETLTLTWPGGSITFTAAALEDYTGLKWPTQGALSLTNYTNAIGAFLRQREDITDTFLVTVENAAGGIIRLTAKIIEAFDLGVTDGFTNVAVTANDGTAPSAEENLRALVQVWKYDLVFNNQSLLLSLHSIYDVPTAATEIDISAAFAHLKPHLPDPATINPDTPAASLDLEEATDVFQWYALRYADKYGSPAVAEAMFLSESNYFAILGSRSAQSAGTGVSALCHAYERADGENFEKPVGRLQPDWLYWWPTAEEDYYLALTIYWSDGTTSAYNPFGTTPDTFEANKVYWMPCGYTQLKLDALAPSGGTDADAHIVGYDFSLKPAGAAVLLARFKVITDSEWHNYILFSNGRGGCETVWMRGKSVEGYRSEGEEFRSPRQSDFTAQDGDLGLYAREARRTFEFASGWYDDPWYVEHLRQLPLGDAWLVDMLNRRFLKIIVDSKEMQPIRADDETLYSLKITAHAGWIDVAANV